MVEESRYSFSKAFKQGKVAAAINENFDNSCWIMKPGFGSECLHLGQSEDEVRGLLGTPQSITRKYKGQYFYNYPSLGLEVDFGKRGGSVGYIFFFREGFRGNRQGPAETIQGIRPGEQRTKVLQLLGEPSEEGKAVEATSVGRLDAWYQYDAGINFQFDAYDAVNMITITAAVHPGGSS